MLGRSADPGTDSTPPGSPVSGTREPTGPARPRHQDARVGGGTAAPCPPCSSRHVGRDGLLSDGTSQRSLGEPPGTVFTKHMARNGCGRASGPMPQGPLEGLELVPGKSPETGSALGVFGEPGLDVPI